MVVSKVDVGYFDIEYMLERAGFGKVHIYLVPMPKYLLDWMWFNKCARDAQRIISQSEYLRAWDGEMSINFLVCQGIFFIDLTCTNIPFEMYDPDYAREYSLAVPPHFPRLLFLEGPSDLVKIRDLSKQKEVS